MAAYHEDLTCCVCRSVFTDPVTLLCGHSHCRRCVAAGLDTQLRCPQCGAADPSGGRLPTSVILESLAEKARDAETKRAQQRNHTAEVVELCPEHEEKLKLFCVTDQQLACIICRDGERHEGHKFKPIKEAAASLKKELEAGLENMCGEILAVETLAKTQGEEITKTKDRSQQLMTQVRRQFEEMHQFLRKREDEIKNELKLQEEDAVEKMSKMLTAMETALSESRELEVRAASVLEIKDPEKCLKSWTEGKSMMTPEYLFRPRANELQVVNTSLSLGPYESHLQFFIWKEMVQVIQPREELLSLKSNTTNLAVSDDGRSLFSTTNQPQSGFSSGQKQTGFAFNSPPKFDQAAFFTSSGNASTSRGGLFGNASTSSGGLFGNASTSSGGLFGNASTFVGGGLSSATFSTSQNTASSFPSSTTYAFSVNEFSSGQHYWEVDVGHREYWELGIKTHFLKYDGKIYSTCSSDVTRELALTDRPRKIGIYLNCSLLKLSFYDADKMTRIHTLSCAPMATPVSAYFNITYRAPDLNPITVCWY